MVIRRYLCSKAPAATIGDLAFAMKEIFNADNEIRIIGTRHGENFRNIIESRGNGEGGRFG